MDQTHARFLLDRLQTLQVPLPAAPANSVHAAGQAHAAAQSKGFSAVPATKSFQPAPLLLDDQGREIDATGKVVERPRPPVCCSAFCFQLKFSRLVTPELTSATGTKAAQGRASKGGGGAEGPQSGRVGHLCTVWLHPNFWHVPLQ